MQRVFIVLLAAAAACGPLSAQQQPKHITSISDLEAGMTRNYVLDRLASYYDIRRELPPSADPDTDNFEPFELWSGDRWAGEIVFQHGKLWSADRTVYYSARSDVVGLAQALYAFILENSMAADVQHDQGTTRLSTRALLANIGESKVGPSSSLWFNVAVGGKQVKQLHLSVDQDSDGLKVRLLELIVIPSQGSAK